MRGRILAVACLTLCALLPLRAQEQKSPDDMSGKEMPDDMPGNDVPSVAPSCRAGRLAGYSDEVKLPTPRSPKRLRRKRPRPRHRQMPMPMNDAGMREMTGGTTTAPPTPCAPWKIAR